MSEKKPKTQEQIRAEIQQFYARLVPDFIKKQVERLEESDPEIVEEKQKEKRRVLTAATSLHKRIIQSADFRDKTHKSILYFYSVGPVGENESLDELFMEKAMNPRINQFEDIGPRPRKEFKDKDFN